MGCKGLQQSGEDSILYTWTTYGWTAVEKYLFRQRDCCEVFVQRNCWLNIRCFSKLFWKKVILDIRLIVWHWQFHCQMKDVVHTDILYFTIEIDRLCALLVTFYVHSGAPIYQDNILSSLFWTERQREKIFHKCWLSRCVSLPAKEK